MNPAQRKRILLIAAGLIVGLFIADRLVLTPQLEAWETRGRRINELQTELSNSVNLLNRENALRADWRNVQTTGLPTDQSAAENQVLKLVDQWSRESGLAVPSIKPRAVEDKSGWNRLEFRASGRGSLENIARFILLMETSSNGLRIEETQISGRENEVNDLTLDIRFSGLMIGPRVEQSAEVAERSGSNAEGGRS